MWENAKLYLDQNPTLTGQGILCVREQHRNRNVIVPEQKTHS